MPTMLYPKTRDEWLALRKRDLTSTKTPALFDASPYVTLFGLTLQMRGQISDEIEDNDRMMIGREMEAVIAKMCAEKKGWKATRWNGYARHSDLDRVAASFDWRVIDHPDGPGLMEIKNLDRSVYWNDWINGDGVGEAPPHIELQLQHQLEVMGYNWGAICALVGGNELVIIERPRDREIGDAILDASRKFLDDLDAGRTPKPQFPRDNEAIKNLYSDGTGDPITLEGDAEIERLMKDYTRLGQQINGLTDERDTIKSNILMKIGNASKVTTSVGTISAGMTKGSTFTVTREPARSMRVNLKKDVKESL